MAGSAVQTAAGGKLQGIFIIEVECKIIPVKRASIMENNFIVVPD